MHPERISKPESWGGQGEMSEKEGRIENNLLTEKLKVVNVGIWTFADDLRSQDVAVVAVDWKPPAGGDVGILRLLEKLGS